MPKLDKSAAIPFALFIALGLAACDDGSKEGGEAGTPAENISESDPEGVGGTSND
jgi:hypothetical protein